MNDLVLLESHALPGTDRRAGLVTLNRPDDLNAMSAGLIREFDRALNEVESDPTMAVLLVTGAGRAFSAGGDLKDYVELQRDEAAFRQFVVGLHQTFSRLRVLSLPVIALVNGVTAAGGLELILNCDMAIAAANARIGDGHLNYGQMGGGGVLTLLPRVVGIQRAAQLIFGGQFLSAHEAERWGLVNWVVPPDELLQSGLDFARLVAVKSPLAVANAKRVLNGNWLEARSVDEGLKFEADTNVRYCTTSHDAPEGLAAFRDKRPPRFEGR